MDLHKSLASAGLALVGQCGDLSELMPPIVSSQAPSCPPEDGRTEFVVEMQDPQLLEKANMNWYRLSLEDGLFSEVDRRFLVALAQPLNEDAPFEWICVELEDSWDIMGKGASGLLGSGYCRPEFRMLSLDGKVLSCGTTWESSISSFTIKMPHRSPVLRSFAEWVATGAIGHSVERIAARRWLDKNPV